MKNIFNPKENRIDFAINDLRSSTQSNLECYANSYANHSYMVPDTETLTEILMAAPTPVLDLLLKYKFRRYLQKRSDSRMDPTRSKTFCGVFTYIRDHVARKFGEEFVGRHPEKNEMRWIAGEEPRQYAKQLLKELLEEVRIIDEYTKFNRILNKE